MGKLIAFIIITILCVAFALIPEAAMWFGWGLIHPETEAGRILVIALFAVFGGSWCVFFGFLGVAIWGSFISAVL